MKTIKKNIGAGIGLALAYGFSGLIILLVLAVLSLQVPVLASLLEELRCVAGVPAADSACVQDKIKALEAERARLEEERDKLAAEKAAYEERQAELEALSRRIQNFTLFEQHDLPSGKVMTGVRFSSLLEPEVWSTAWCYLSVSGSRGALQQRLDLGDLDPGEDVQNALITRAIREELGLTEADIAEALEACVWPKGSS